MQEGRSLAWHSGDQLPTKQGRYLCIYQKKRRPNQGRNEKTETYHTILFFRLQTKHASFGTSQMIKRGQLDEVVETHWYAVGYMAIPMTGKVLFWTEILETPDGVELTQ